MDKLVIIPEGKRHIEDIPTHYRVISGSKQLSINASDLNHPSPNVNDNLVSEIRQYLNEFMMPVPVITFKRVEDGV